MSTNKMNNLVKRYRKKPIVIHAIQWDGSNDCLEQLCYRFPVAFGSAIIHNGREIVVKTLEGNMIADIGDYIIRGIKGEFYPIKEDIFLESYDEVTE